MRYQVISYWRIMYHTVPKLGHRFAEIGVIEHWNYLW